MAACLSHLDRGGGLRRSSWGRGDGEVRRRDEEEGEKRRNGRRGGVSRKRLREVIALTPGSFTHLF